MGGNRTELIHLSLNSIIRIYDSNLLWIKWEMFSSVPIWWLMKRLKPLGCWAHWRKGVTAVGRLLQFYIPSALRPFSASWFTGIWEISDTCFHAFISMKDHISWNPGAKLKSSSLMLLFLRVLGHSNEKNDLIQYNYKLHLHNILKFKMSTTHLIWVCSNPDSSESEYFLPFYMRKSGNTECYLAPEWINGEVCTEARFADFSACLHYRLYNYRNHKNT